MHPYAWIMVVFTLHKHMQISIDFPYLLIGLYAGY